MELRGVLNWKVCWTEGFWGHPQHCRRQLETVQFGLISLIKTRFPNEKTLECNIWSILCLAFRSLLFMIKRGTVFILEFIPFVLNEIFSLGAPKMPKAFLLIGWMKRIWLAVIHSLFLWAKRFFNFSQKHPSFYAKCFPTK